MEEHKEQNQKEPEEEYSFLQEVIKDEAGGVRRLRSQIMHMIALGFVFGIVACFSFVVSKPWIEGKLGEDPEQVTIPKDEEEQEETSGEEEAEKEGGIKDAEKEEGEKNAEGENEEEKKEDVKKEDGQKNGQAAKEDRPPLDTESYREMLQSLRETVKETEGSIVEITGLAKGDKWTDELKSSKHSVSGVIIADNGKELLILAKVCPVKSAEKICVSFLGGDLYEASVKASDVNLGLSVYAVPRSEIAEDTWTKIDIAVLGNSKLVNVGDTAIVLGKPFGYANAYTYGVVSLDRAHMNFSDGQYEVVCTDISGSDGASGVLVNVRGEVIAIVNQTLLEEDNRNQIAGYGISDIKDIIEFLSNAQGVPYIGITGIDVTEDMEGQGLPKGVYVKKVETDSPAMTAGIQNGDIITVVDDTEITDMKEYHEILMKKADGDRIALKGCRQGTGGEYVDIDFTVTISAKN